MGSSEYNKYHPDTIIAEAEARRIKTEARAMLHPVAQSIYAFFDGLSSAVSLIGCVAFLGLALILPIVICGSRIL